MIAIALNTVLITVPKSVKLFFWNGIKTEGLAWTNKKCIFLKVKSLDVKICFILRSQNNNYCSFELQIPRSFRQKWFSYFIHTYIGGWILIDTFKLNNILIHLFLNNLLRSLDFCSFLYVKYNMRVIISNNNIISLNQTAGYFPSSY